MRNPSLTCLFVLIYATAGFAQSNMSDSVTITTYYPAPYGVYKNMRLYPSDQPTAGVDRGVLYFNRTDDSLYVFKNNTARWQPVGGGSWAAKGNDIYNINTGNVGIGTQTPAQKLEVAGNIAASGDVCLNSGECLSSVYQTNVVSGSNPGCPANQTILMKAYNGIWYTADNPSITSWNKASCGATLDSNGLPTSLMANGEHSAKQCNEAGGQVVNDGRGFSMCRFGSASRPVASCPSDWRHYNGWSTTVASTTAPLSVTCYWTGINTCTTGSHGWSDNGNVEKCQIYCYTCRNRRSWTDSPMRCVTDTSCSPSIGNGVCGSDSQTYHGSACATARVIQVGCY